LGCRIPVYIINALYLWPITVWTYIKYGRPEMPKKGKKIEDRAEAGERDPLLHSYHQIDHGEGNTGGERHSGGSETVTDPRAGHHGVKMTNGHDGHGMEHGGGANQHHDMSADRPMFATITIATCHCGAGCVLGDIIGEWLIYRSDATIGGSMLYAAFIVGKSAPIPGPDLPTLSKIRRSADTLAFLLDFVLALAFGIVFQYFSIAPMAGDYGWKTIVRSAKADFLSLTFFEIGLFGWMAIFDLVIFDQKLRMNTVTYWFMMQVGLQSGSDPS
jgi:hypothetical protein